MRDLSSLLELRFVGDRRPPTWLLGAIVALLGWRVGMNPPSIGLDLSWNAGLSMAAEQSLQFGSEIVFAYGPLGFLRAQGVWFGDLAVLTFLYAAALYVVFCIAMVWALRRSLPALAAALIAFLVVAVLPLLEQSLLVAVLVCIGALERQRSATFVNALLAGGATFAAVEGLVKLSTGPLIAAIFFVALIGLRARWWQPAGFVALLAAETLLLWSAAGQSLSGLPDFIANTREIVSGYSAAMPRLTDKPAWQVVAITIAAAAVSIALVLAAARADYRDNRARWAAVALMALAAFTVFKEGVVRTDAGHLSLFFSTACVLWIAIPRTRARWYWTLAGVGTIVALGLPVRPPGLPTNLDVVANVRYAAEQVPNLLSSSRRDDLIATGRTGMKAVYRLDRPTREALSGRTVAVEPWEIGAVWAYGFDWAPLPVFQNYSAYTSKLDRLNAAAVADPAGPERILRENPALVYPEFLTRTVDNRYPGWDPPAQARAVLCHFAVLRETARWQVLGRTPSRCGAPQPIRTVDAGPGETLPVPAPGRDEVVFARIEGADVGGLEKLLALAFHARLRHVTLDGTETYRLVPGTAADGLMLRGSPGIDGSGAFVQIPQAKAIAITGSGDLRVSFFRMKVHPPSTGAVE